MSGPPPAERFAARRQLADEVRQRAVVGVAAGLVAQVGDEVLGGLLPVDEELLGGGVEEGEARAVGRLLAAVEQRRVERAAELVGGQVVAARVADRRRRADGVEDLSYRRSHALLGGAPAALSGRGDGGASEVEEMGALGVVEPQRIGERVEDAVGGAGRVAALEALVVLGAHPRQRGNLLAAQSGHLAPPVARQASLLRRDL